MWKQRSDNQKSQQAITNPAFVPYQNPAPQPPQPTSNETATKARVEAPAADQAVIAKGLTVQGEISGVDSLYIDGTVEGTVHIPGQRVTVGRNGRVIAAKPEASPCILAREIVILGAVTGNIEATERVELRAQASLAGDVGTARVAIEDGAYFKGGIDIRREDKPAQASDSPQSAGSDSEATPRSSAPQTVQV